MNNIVIGLGKLHDLITEVAYVIGVLLLAAILFMFCYEITARYFFRAPTHWIADFTGYALLISTFLLAPRITRQNGHIAISFLRDALQGRARYIVDFFVLGAAAIACVWAGYYAIEEAMRQFDRGTRTLAVVSVPRWWFSAAIAYGFVNSGIYFCRISLRSLFKTRTTM